LLLRSLLLLLAWFQQWPFGLLLRSLKKAVHAVAVAETSVVVVVHVRKGCCFRYLMKWQKHASRESHD
jgi:hypothetical protein